MELQTITQSLDVPAKEDILSFNPNGILGSFTEPAKENLIAPNSSSSGLKRISETPKKTSPFIESNCESVTLTHLRDDNITPVFSKCNSVTISHYDFIQATTDCVFDFYKGETVLTPEIRVSHKILGRVQEALKKPKAELLPHEETIFWERAAFAIEIPSISMKVGGNTLSLVVGGVRTFQNQNLYTKKTVERFKVFSGFVNNVCTNTCVNTDGILLDVRVLNLEDLKTHIYQLLNSYDMNSHLKQMRELENLNLTQNQFCQLIGKSRLYQHLPKELKTGIPEMLFNDGQINAMAKAYIEDENFKCNENGEISLWKLFNLYTGVNKSSYIDTFLERSENAFSFTRGIAKAINGDDSYRWYFLS